MKTFCATQHSIGFHFELWICVINIPRVNILCVWFFLFKIFSMHPLWSWQNSNLFFFLFVQNSSQSRGKMCYNKNFNWLNKTDDSNPVFSVHQVVNESKRGWEWWWWSSELLAHVKCLSNWIQHSATVTLLSCMWIKWMKCGGALLTNSLSVLCWNTLAHVMCCVI